MIFHKNKVRLPALGLDFYMFTYVRIVPVQEDIHLNLDA